MVQPKPKTIGIVQRIAREVARHSVRVILSAPDLKSNIFVCGYDIWITKLNSKKPFVKCFFKNISNSTENRTVPKMGQFFFIVENYAEFV